MNNNKSSINFEYNIPVTMNITYAKLRKTLGEVRDQLLSHKINGGKRKLYMNAVCAENKNGCGTVACIGGWTSLFLLGFEGNTPEQREIVDCLFEELLALDSSLDVLFYRYRKTYDYDDPNVAATAIQRHLKGEYPWPEGQMPNILPYAKKVSVKKKAKAKKTKR